MEEIVHRESGCADQGAERARGEFFVLRDRQIGANAGLGENEMTADLASCLPTCSDEGLGSFLTGDVGQSSHAPRVVQAPKHDNPYMGYSLEGL